MTGGGVLFPEVPSRCQQQQPAGGSLRSLVQVSWTQALRSQRPPQAAVLGSVRKCAVRVILSQRPTGSCSGISREPSRPTLLQPRFSFLPADTSAPDTADRYSLFFSQNASEKGGVAGARGQAEGGRV
ncbi:hypothetical protein AAFF_G00160380 [Aldrovandia affinis]|uniref:Uncharacterized protein n=1 Tax=Aldrovandia affinis TaxID=143900 RepID=A0AAD7RML0_9TELE|nr:hypothetical protein AAFF_G00160380 [Aldrovandia affinis]